MLLLIWAELIFATVSLAQAGRGVNKSEIILCRVVSSLREIYED
jgi:hypothetical protein